MKLLGISCGKRNGNSEILLKEAMAGAEEKGIETEWLRLIDLDIKSCLFCKNCLKREGGPEACIVKDDVPFAIEKIQQCDGLILAVPAYILTPPGYFKLFADRVLEDLAGVIQMRNRGGINLRTGKKVYLDERSLKKRVGGFICQGGAVTHHWIGLGLPLMHTLTFPRQIDLVDQMEVMSLGNNPGSVLLQKDKVKRAKLLGRNVAAAMIKIKGKKWQGDELGNYAKQAADVPQWKGDEIGTCPVCHTNLLLVGKENPIECAVCGSRGNIKVVNNKIKVTFSKKEQAISRLTLEGKRIHQDEIMGCVGSLLPRQAELDKMAEKYKSYKAPLKAPPRKPTASKATK